MSHTSNKRFDFAADSDHEPDPRIFNGVYRCRIASGCVGGGLPSPSSSILL